MLFLLRDSDMIHVYSVHSERCIAHYKDMAMYRNMLLPDFIDKRWAYLNCMYANGHALQKKGC